ncbi:hypothetical protein SYJ56_23575 [Algoriphagus sp. D3-2-R+10]|uniref:methyltransferase domain-containing protein n=1 Tax=Algoriphagus aurantiacus TaxID=3103948 RepID=UPI002B3FF94D|nr:methyltransferase domain-containing protein [Algoriphagus sp. D3-2-R+10]MEB2778311.1 hypothetical protein [Algoriphagus sp. D3-2-R+10]
MSSKKLYNESFYKSRNSNTKDSAIQVLSLLFKYISPKSMVDFGCGVGTWIKTGQELGVNKILGLEGNWLDTDHLVISLEEFKNANLASEINLDTPFDLAISLEVAEHIDEKFSEIFIDNLTKASEIVLFSAAIPGQRGSGHVNEQWPEYWIEKFNSRNYVALDIIRPFIWSEPKIKSWYKQNTILFMHKDRVSDYSALVPFLDESRNIWSIVHPDVFVRQIQISHPKFSNFSQVVGSLPIVTFRSAKRFLKNLVRG